MKMTAFQRTAIALIVDATFPTGYRPYTGPTAHVSVPLPPLTIDYAADTPPNPDYFAHQEQRTRRNRK
jgi:hypothetical protein